MIGPGAQYQNKARLISRRMFVLSLAKTAVFFALITRLFYLQISENIKYKSLSDKNRLREWKVPPQRGVIRDYFNKPIATNKQVFQLHMVPEDVPNLTELLFKLSKLINFDEKQKNNLLKKIKRRKPWQPVIISDDLTWSEFSKLNLFLNETQGLKPVVALARKYLSDGSSAHVIGYVSEVSKKDLQQNKFLREVHVPGLKTGKNGLEKSLNKSIIGSPGFQRFEVNAYGKRIKELKFTQGSVGKNFKTTLDLDVQKFANELIKDKSGSICVMDIYTGDIVAMVSSPTFDPNKFVLGINSKEWKQLLDNPRKPLLNKSVSGLYPPGSTIKPIVALSALENDVISPKLIVQCKGKIELYGQTYHCWKEKGHGYMNLRESVKQSCDVYFYEVARRLGVDRLSITAKKFGLGEKVFDNLMEEKIGVVPNTKWKTKNIGQSWVLGETLIAGIGQGYYQSSPIQICLMTAQLANGGYKIKPRIIHNSEELNPIVETWRKEFSQKRKKNNQADENTSDSFFEKSGLTKLYRNQENIKFIQDCMYAATNEPMGTSYRSRLTDPKYMYAGKTGTSQIRRITEEQRKLKLKNKDLPYESRDHALFTAFAPYKQPRYAFSIVIEHGGSGSSGAAPLAKKLIKKVMQRHEERKKYTPNLFQDI
jgi:penicillin-binding protein 2